jgi:hypothetical protein
MNLIKNIIPVFLIVFALLSCREDKEWSEDFDIEYPVSTITSFSPTAQAVGGDITISGTNLEHALFVRIGNAECEIKSKTSTSIVVTVSEFAQDKDFVSVENIYTRQFVYETELFRTSD